MIVRELLARVGIDLDEKSVARADSAISGLKKGLVALGSAYVLKKAYDFVSGQFSAIAESAEALTLLSQKTGVSVEQLQALQYAARMTNVDTGELQMALVHLARSAQEAATTGGAAGAAFYRLGLNVRDATTGKLKPTAQLLGELSDKFKAMPDGPEKAAASIELLSRSGANLIPFLNKGSDGLAAMGIEARKTGSIMSAGLIRQGVELEHSIKRLHATIWGLTISVLGPFVKRMTEGKESLAAWIQAHRQLIAAGIQGFFQTLFGAMKGVVEMAGKFPAAFGIAAAAITTMLSPVTMAIAAFLLVAEDLYGYFNGKESLFGHLLELKGDKGWLAFLYDEFEKFALWLVEQIKKLPERFKSATEKWSEGERAGLFGTAAGAVAGGLLGGTKGAAVGGLVGGWLVRALTEKIEGFADKADSVTGSLLRGGAGSGMPGSDYPLIPHSANVAPPLFPGAYAPTTINIYPPSGDPVAIGEEVNRRFDQRWDSKMRESAPSGR